MKMLPPALEMMSNYNQFILWRPIWNDKKNKYDKKPVSAITGAVVDYTDSCNLTDYQTAFTAVNSWATDCNIGFVLSANDPYFFLDLDECYSDGRWSDLAMEIVGRFPGAAVEVSSSRRGLHILGVTKPVNHRKKNKQKHLELYTEKRFIALTGLNIQGNIHRDFSIQLDGIISEYFPPADHDDDLPDDWTTQPNSLWRGPLDDSELIQKFLDVKSARKIFGAGMACSLADLWAGNAAEIAKIYPAIGDPSCDYDRSSADMGLCIQLAWWTGGDCERIERLFAKSGLVRDKWLTRETYRRETITNAVQQCQGCLGADMGRREASALAWGQSDSSEIITSSRVLSGPRVVAFNDRPEFFKNHFYIRSLNRVLCPDGITRDMTAYNSCYAGYEFLQPFGSSKPIKDPWKAYVTAVDVERMEAHDVAYLPAKSFLSTHTIHGKNYVNVYENQDITPVAGDASPFLNHLKKLLPSQIDCDILLAWIAAFLQHPGKKFRWALFLQGAEGCGKSLITRILKNIIGDKHVYQINPEDFCSTGGKFNRYMQFTRLGVLEEMRVGERRQSDPALKRIIDHDRIEIQAKGVDQYTATFCMNLIINSNFQDALPIDESSRRYAPLFCAQQTVHDIQRDGMDSMYFHKLTDWLENQNGYAICANYLLNHKIPFELNPATGAHRAPLTTAFGRAVLESMPQVEVAIRDAIASEESGTKNGWVSVQALTSLLNTDNVKLHNTRQITKTLEKMGYVTLPCFDNNRGRTTQLIANEGSKRVKLYVKSDHSILQTGNDQWIVTNAYRRDQGYLQNVIPPPPTHIHPQSRIIQ